MIGPDRGREGVGGVAVGEGRRGGGGIRGLKPVKVDPAQQNG